MKKTFKVGFVAYEKCINKCVAYVEANTPKEAYDKVADVINSGRTPFLEFLAEWDGVNSVTLDVIGDSSYSIDDEPFCGISDVKEINDCKLIQMVFTAKELIRFSNSDIKARAEEIFGAPIRELGKIKPISILDDIVTYEVEVYPEETSKEANEKNQKEGRL